MKIFCRVLCLMTCLSAATSTLKAQIYNVVYGRATVKMDPSLFTALRGYMTITDIQGHPLTTSAPLIMKVNTGILSVNNGSGELILDGGLIATTSSAVVMIQNPILDLTNPSAPVVTAVVSANGGSLGRVPLFNVTAPSSAGSSLSAQNSTVTQAGYAFRLTSTIANLTNQLAGTSIVTQDQPFGAVTFYNVLSSSPSGVN